MTASDSFRFPACNVIKKETPAKMLVYEFFKIFKTISRQKHLRMTASCVYLWILRSFSDHLFHKVPLGNCLFHLQVAEFQPPPTVKKYFTSAFQAFYTSRSSYSKSFMYLKYIKTICEKGNLQWSCEMLTCKLKKKTLSHILHFAFIFLEYTTITISRLQYYSGNISGK